MLSVNHDQRFQSEASVCWCCKEPAAMTVPCLSTR